MSATTAKRGRRTKPEGQPDVPDEEVAEPTGRPAGGPVSSDSDKVSNDLASRLLQYGFTADANWDSQIQSDAAAILNAWDRNRTDVRAGHEVPFESRLQIPLWLRSHDQPSDMQIAKASLEGRAARDVANSSSDLNPYPTGSRLFEVWNQGLWDALSGNPVDGGGDQPQAGDGSDAAPVAGESAKPAEDKKESADERNKREQQEAIVRLQREMEQANCESAALADQIELMSSEVKSLKSRFNDAGLRGRTAARKLQLARNGFFDRPAAQQPLPGMDAQDPMEPPYAGDSFGVGSDQQNVTDVGATISLDYLKRGELQEYIPGTADHLGLSAKQVENLKEAIGDTIGHLEKFMHENGEWWLKSLGDKVDGFGQATRDKLVDAYEVIRRKYPVPDPSDAVTESQPAKSDTAIEQGDAERSSDAPNSDPDVIAKTIELLDQLIGQCQQYLQEPGANNDGKEFCTSVANRAAQVKETIQNVNEVTEPQTKAIHSWLAAVGNWARTLPE